MDFIEAYDIGISKPNIPEKIYSSWQEIVDTLASIADVPSALIMHVLPDKMEVASTSHTQPENNPYDVEASEHLGCGLYCETVIKEKAELHVPNSLKDEDWKDNPDVAIGMIGYYGQPLLWPDNTAYGTICILDKKDLFPSTTVKELLGLFRKSIENDLEILELSYNQEKLLQSEIAEKTKQIQEQNLTLKDLNKNLEQRVDEEVKKNHYQQHQMFAQSRLVQIGEMISMIAHQWRQPLSEISMVANNIIIDIELDSVEEDSLGNSVNNIVHMTKELSKTIDDFRNFYTPNQQSVIIKLEDVIEKSLNIIKPTLINNNINLVEEYNSDEEIQLYDSEVMQVILNILKNAQDSFQKQQTNNQKIIIKTENRTISICNNAGRISEDVIDKIFDPYFSTKDEKNGMGLGLYMSKTIIEKHHNGKLRVKNTDDGVCFRIELGIISEK